MESLTAYLAVDTAAAIGAWTVGIQLPLSDVSFLTMGFGGRRWPDACAIGALNQAFSGFRQEIADDVREGKSQAISRSDIAGFLSRSDIAGQAAA